MGETGDEQAMRTRRRWPVWVLLGLVVLPVVEIIVLVGLGKTIGWLPTVLALVAITVLGAVLVRREGPRTWQSLRASVSGGVVDGVRVNPSTPRPEQLSDGVIVLIGAILLLLPGFFTDVLAIICLLPATRPLPRRLFAEFVRSRAQRVINTARGQVITQSVDQQNGPRNGPGPIAPNRILPPKG